MASSTRFCHSRTEVPWSPPPPRRVRISTISIEAPNEGAATQLLSDLVPFARIDVLPLDDERWEVRVEESSGEELDAVLLAVARWTAANGLPQRCVQLDGRPVELPDPA